MLHKDSRINRMSSTPIVYVACRLVFCLCELYREYTQPVKTLRSYSYLFFFGEPLKEGKLAEVLNHPEVQIVNVGDSVNDSLQEQVNALVWHCLLKQIYLERAQH